MFSQIACRAIVASFLLLGSYVAAEPEYPPQLCSNTTTQSTNSDFEHNLDNLLASLSSNASTSKFHAASSGDGRSKHKVYGLFMCYGDNTRESCHNCVKLASSNVKKFCPNADEATRWEDECQLRYSNKEFFRTLHVVGNMGFHNSEEVRSEETEVFKSAVTRVLNNVAAKAADRNLSPENYAFADEYYEGSKTLYATAQCTGDLSRDDCKKCLAVAIANASSCCSAFVGARVLSQSCYLRYEKYKFYGEALVPKKGKNLNDGTIIIFVVLGIIAVLLLGSFVYCLKPRFGANRENYDQELALHKSAIDPNEVDFIQRHLQPSGENGDLPIYFDLVTLNEATRNFAESNLLGEGGFGPVYKGKLGDGREIAVKRLSSFSEQGVEEFTNEVLLIMKLQHKNLVKLYGFCVNGEEKLLVYEYMPNGSLDAVLFDSIKRAIFDWKARVDVINGIARGMVYLHEDSRLRIIHRDLKASNVLLDSEMNPKISDFGMARIFLGSEGEASTCRLVGTYGYMAPEYAMHGHYSVKSDVFSFGVLMLEIISGKKNAGFQRSKRTKNLIEHAWQLWNEGTALELMDPTLKASCAPDEFLKCIYVGLLCVQDDAQERPTMASVTVMLNSESDVALPQPERPGFSWGTSTDYDEININALSFNGVNFSSVSYQSERN